MKNKFSFIFVYWWLLVLLVGGLSLAVFAEKEQRVSESENRTLSGFPELTAHSLLSGEFFTGIESYLSDGMFGRDSIVGVSEGVLGLFSRSTIEDESLLEKRRTADEMQGIYEDATAGEQPQVPSGSDAEGEESGGQVSEELPAEIPDQTVTEELNGYGLWMKLRSGGYSMLVPVAEKRVEQVVGTLNLYRERLPEDGNVFFLHVPFTRATLNLRQDKYTGWVDNTAEVFGKYAGEDVTFIDVAGLLEPSLLAGEHVYFASDHHWSPRGAIMAVNECIKKTGLPAVPFEEYEYRINTFSSKEKHTSDDLELPYTLQDVKGNIIYQGQPVKSWPLVQYTYKTYVAYLSGDNDNWTRYRTGFSTGRNALVIGDSFSNAFTVYLMPYYDEVSKIDIRHYSPREEGATLGDIIRKGEIDDIYVVVSHGNGFDSKNSYYRLEQLLGEQ